MSKKRIDLLQTSANNINNRSLQAGAKHFLPTNDKQSERILWGSLKTSSKTVRATSGCFLPVTTYQCLETKNKKQIRALPEATPKLSSEDYGTGGNRKISRVPHTKNSFSARHSPILEAEPEYVPRLTFWICLSNEMLQMRSIPTICTSQMPLTNPHWFSRSKNNCQLTFSDMFLTKIRKLMKRYSHRARLQVLCHSLQGPLHEPLSEALWESCSAWQHRCGESVSFHLANSEMQNCITCPKMMIALVSFVILTKSAPTWQQSRPKTSGKLHQALKILKANLELKQTAKESKQTSNWWIQKIYTDMTAIPKFSNGSNVFKCFCCQGNLIKTFCARWLPIASLHLQGVGGGLRLFRLRSLKCQWGPYGY